MAIESVNPATGKRIRKYAALKPRPLAQRIEAADARFAEWKSAGFPARARLVEQAGKLLRERKQSLAELMAQEMGKPLAQGISEIEKCAWACEYYAGHAESFLKDEEIGTDASRSYVHYSPLGAVLAIMPWNFPFWQVFRFAAPALMAGNTGVLKHASNVPGCSMAIEELLRDAGFPEGVFQSLLIGSDQVESVIGHEKIRAVTLTGSTDAGKAVAAQAGGLVKKTVLELGGSDPYIILEDADLEAAARICVDARLVNTGQSCIAAKRFIVLKEVEKKFLEYFEALMKERKMGDPLDPGTQLGPLARAELRDNLHEQVLASLAKGAKRLLGGEKPEGPGAFYPASILTGVKRGMPAYSEELFGPVAAVISARSEAEAIRIANDTSFGLGAAVFTGDPERGERIASRQLEAGACFVNAQVHSDPRLPFGGIRESGYGRELGLWGIREFVNIKSVYVA